jgi:carboxyl-terminal processing protease
MRYFSAKKIKNKVRMKIKKKAIAIVLILLVSGFAFMGLNNSDNKNFEIAKNLDIYYTLFRELNTFYVDEVEPGELVKESIDEMLKSLDPYTTYIPESDIEDFRFMTTGEYGGIGALISKHGDEIVVSEPYKDFPAYKSGLKAGDVFLEVAGKSIDKLGTEDVSNLLKGAAGQTVEVVVERYGHKKPLTFDIVREKISIDPISYYGMLDDKTGYIRLTNFTKDCGEKVKKALLELKEVNGAEKLVLDLRGNPGGLLMESVNIVNLFIPHDQEVVSTKGKVSQWDKTYKTTGSPVDTLMPLAVLVSRGSASASEIVSGTIQDLDRGIILGDRTFGKGLVQTTRDLSYNAKLKVTTAKYYTPSGRCIQALDYSHRNEDGSVGHVPDSLISEFQTKNGRIVKDGGGIRPDVDVNNENISNLAVKLIQQFKIFDFSTRFAADNESIPQPEEFEINDQIYNNFIDFVENGAFEYTSKTQQKLEDLKELAQEEKYFELAEDEFTSLEQLLKLDLDRDLKKFRDQISQILKSEIVSRYYYQEGTARANIGEDKTINRALEVLSSPKDYKALLTPGE